MSKASQEQLQSKCVEVIWGTHRKRPVGNTPNNRLQRTRKLAAEPNRSGRLGKFHMKQKVYLAKNRDWGFDELEELTPCAEMVSYDGPYFFIYQDIVALQDKTGELIDRQMDAFFAGPALDALEAFLLNVRDRVAIQPDHWQQRVGRTWPTDEPVYMPVSRAETIAILDKLIQAVSLARQRSMGLFFRCE